MKQGRFFSILLLGLVFFNVWIFPAQALDHIIRSYQSVRSAGMGGVRITTGLYDENFFANPARVTDNPKSKLTLFDPMFETTVSTISHVSDLTGSHNALNAVGDAAGNNLHARFQTTMPSYYRVNPDSKIAWALGLFTSTQVDLALRRSYQLDPITVVDIGPAFTLGKRFMEYDELSVGLTAHFAYRASTDKNFKLVDFIKGTSFSPNKTGGDGAHIDLDIGATWKFVHWTPKKWHFQTGLAINNLIGGAYRNIPIHFLKNGKYPIQQYTSLGLGVSATREELWFFRNFVGAIEMTDWGNNKHGSLFRMLHIGAEAKFRILKPRIGINQGYLAGGLNIDIKLLQIDLATYGEEMSLNAGGLEDRRFALRLALEI